MAKARKQLLYRYANACMQAVGHDHYEKALTILEEIAKMVRGHVEAHAPNAKTRADIG